MAPRIAAETTSPKATQENTIDLYTRATLLEVNGHAKAIAVETSEATGKDAKEVDVEDTSEMSENAPAASEFDSASALGTGDIIDDRIQDITVAGNGEDGKTSGESARLTPAAEVDSNAEDDTEHATGETDEAKPTEDKESCMSEEEAKKIARRNWIQDQIDLAEADVAEQRKGIEELEEARTMMEKNIMEEIAAVEAKQKKAMAKLSKVYEKAEVVEQAKEVENEGEAQEAKEGTERS